MTDLFLTERIEPLIPKVQSFIQEELLPLEKDFLNRPWREIAPKIEKKRAKVKELGLWGLALPPSLGGLGLSLVEFGQLSERIARTPIGHYAFNCQAPDIGNMELLHQFATPAQQERYLRPLAAGDIRSCFAMTEPEFAGSNPVWMGTTAKRDGDHYVIKGHKWFTTGADGARFTIVMAITDQAAPKHQRASMILVPTDQEGFEVVRNIPIMGEAGSGYMSHSEVRFNDCRVPIVNRIGEEGAGFRLAQERLGPGRIHHCMRWIGISERALDMLCQYATERKLSPEQSLADKQIIQHWIAEARAEINAARLTVLDTARIIDQKGAPAARNEISAIKFYVADIMLRVVDRAIQVHGARGLTEETVLSFFYRHERGARIYDGADEVHKSALARQILKKYA